MSTAGELSGAGPRYYAEPRTHQRHSLDFYTEPEWTVDLLLDAESFEGEVWDPACGSGTIPRRCVARGIEATGSDIANRGFGEVADFLDPALEGARGYDLNVVTNPPYGLAEAFIRRGLAIASRKVAVLVQSKFPYSQRRHALFTLFPPRRIYFLSTRPSMPPGDKLLAGTVEAKGGKLDYCWIVWEAGWLGTTEAHWLRRDGAT